MLVPSIFHVANMMGRTNWRVACHYWDQHLLLKTYFITSWILLGCCWRWPQWKLLLMLHMSHIQTNFWERSFASTLKCQFVGKETVKPVKGEMRHFMVSHKIWKPENNFLPWQSFLRNEVMIAIFIVNGGCTSVKKLRLYEPGKHFHQAHLFLSSWWIIHTQDGWRLWRRTNLRRLRREYFDAEMSSFYLIEVNGSLNERQVKWRLRISNVDAQDWDWEFSKLVVKLSCDQNNSE